MLHFPIQWGEKKGISMYTGPIEPKSTPFWPSCEWSLMDTFDVYCQEVFLAYTRNAGLTSWLCLMNKWGQH